MMYGPGFATYVSSEPAIEPVTTADMKTHLRVSSSTDDSYIAALVTVARRNVEQYLGKSLITQTRVLKLDAFPYYPYPTYWNPRIVALELPYGPVQSVTSVGYVDTSGAAQTWGSSNYTVDIYSWPARIVPIFGTVWPVTQFVVQAATVTYIAGYGATAASVPAEIIHALKLMVGHLYENREATDGGVNMGPLPMGVEALLAPQRIVSL